MNDLPNAIPWYKSSIFVGILVSLVCKALILSGLTGDIAPADQLTLTNLLIGLIGGAADLLALVKRVKQEKAPVITATASKATEVHERIEADKPQQLVGNPAQEVPSWMRP